MRFSLQDVKKSVHRRAGGLNLSLHLLRPGELRDEIRCLIAYHERLLGQPQRNFSSDEARACIGDYRLANCLIATLSNWYVWRTREWADVLAMLEHAPDSDALNRLPTTTKQVSLPVQLRLALYDYVNEHHHGFLDTRIRQTALQEVAALYGLSVADLEYLLVMDSEEEALLVRDQSTAPEAHIVTALYNQWAFEAALCSASRVRFVIDCTAFASADAAPGVVNMGVGAVIKRLGYLARRMGVYYDLEYEPVQGTLSREVSALLALTLYGPQEVTGAPQQYGLRLARLCRVLLGYGVPKGEPGEQGRNAGRAVRQIKRTFSRAIVEAEATVHFLQRTYSFVMDADLLALLPSVSPADPQSGRDTAASTLFDSGVEQNFSEAFSALAESKGVDGWQMEREPEPLLVESGILIPDFAFTRGRRRIYVEILGFWTPSYRERKIQKLQQLRGRDDLLLAIPLEAKEAFAAIANDFPIVYYDEQLSMSDMLQVLRGRYDDFAERLTMIDVGAVRQQVRSSGLLPEPLSADVLGCYRRSELARAAERVVDDETIFMAGIGLLARYWLELWQQAGSVWIDRDDEHTHSVPLGDILKAVREQWPLLIDCDDGAVEALVSLWPGVSIRRESIFEAVVEFEGAPQVGSDEAVKDDKAEDGSAGEKETKKPGRRAAAKKRSSVVSETVQGDLWG